VTLIYGQDTHSRLGDTKKLKPTTDEHKPAEEKTNL
jgi:hypothetical protein